MAGVITDDQHIQKTTKAEDGSLHVPEIPDDILVEILVKLPILSIMRCKSVSKTWNSLISNKFFPINRVTNSISHLICHGFNYKNPKMFNIFTVNVHDIIYKEDDRLYPAIAVPVLRKIPSRQIWQDKYRIIDSCNGLLLYWYVGKPLFVVNPSNQTWFELPTSHRLKSYSSNFLKLVFEPTVSQHFKVIRIMFEIDYWQTFTFSSELGEWTASNPVKLPQFLPNKFDLRKTELLCPISVFVGGTLYLRNIDELVRVNIDEETLEVIQFPSADVNNRRQPADEVNNVGVSKGCVHWCEFSSKETAARIWVLEDSRSNEWRLKSTLSYDLLFAEFNFLDPPYSGSIEACFHPHIDAVFIRLREKYITYYEFGSMRKKAFVKFEDPYWWRPELIPLSLCLVDLFKVGKKIDVAKVV